MPVRNATGVDSPVVGPEPKQGVVVIIVIAVAAAVAVLVVIAIIWWWWWRRGKIFRPAAPPSWPPAVDPQIERAVSFDSRVLRKATKDFASSNRLGVGGFGVVYKGKLRGGKEVAIKRLSTGSIQGIKELATEVVLVTRLQHDNLVKVIGYCLEEEHTLLVYEYLPNRSLDKVLEDEQRRRNLAWTSRFNIIKGIGSGILYLHDESHIKVIHRDLKTANILLDKYMNPKISDFGLSKLFDDDQTHANASKVAGTLGYIAPEYLTRAVYSTKSDVYSYGIMVLEIVTGRMISSFPGTGRGLPNFVVQNWNKGTMMRVLDPLLGGACCREEVMASIYVGLLCTQKEEKVRPEISMVMEILRDPAASPHISSFMSGTP